MPGRSEPMRTNHPNLAKLSLARAVLHTILLLASINFAQSAPAPAFYVSLNGNDQWSGRATTPNSARKDGPFATVERALQATRDWKKRADNSNSGSPTIYLAEGFYEL